MPAAAADVISSNHFKSKHFLSIPKASGKTLSFLQKALASLQLIQLLKKNEYILYDAWQATIWPIPENEHTAVNKSIYTITPAQIKHTGSEHTLRSAH